MPDLNTYNLTTELAKKKNEVGAALVTVGTTVNLNSVTNAINTTGKYQGKQVYNATSGQLVIASGSSAASVWNNSGTGAAAHTPV